MTMVLSVVLSTLKGDLAPELDFALEDLPRPSFSLFSMSMRAVVMACYSFEVVNSGLSSLFEACGGLMSMVDLFSPVV